MARETPDRSASAATVSPASSRASRTALPTGTIVIIVAIADKIIASEHRSPEVRGRVIRVAMFDFAGREPRGRAGASGVW
jgi:hypothetical protein